MEQTTTVTYPATLKCNRKGPTMQPILLRTLIITLVTCNLLAAQETDLKPIHVPQKGDRALQFAVRGLFNLSSFQGGTLSYKKHFSSQSALRIGINIRLNSRAYEGSEEWDNTYRYEDYEDSTDYLRFEEETYDLTDNSDIWSADIITQWIKYPEARNDVQPYWGVGPTLSYSYHNEDDESASMDSTADPRFYRYTSFSYGVGVSGVLGLEWFFRKNMSLTAEYQSSFQARYGTTQRHLKRTSSHLYYDEEGTIYRWRSETREQESEVKSSRPDLSLTSSMKLGLSLYF